MATHVHQARPGEANCFVCNVNIDDVKRDEAGLRPMYHHMVARTYGDQEIYECQCCGTEWPCPAIKAIRRNSNMRMTHPSPPQPPWPPTPHPR